MILNFVDFVKIKAEAQTYQSGKALGRLTECTAIMLVARCSKNIHLWLLSFSDTLFLHFSRGTEVNHENPQNECQVSRPRFEGRSDHYIVCLSFFFGGGGVVTVFKKGCISTPQ
jgi:hypothetical protein